MSETVISFRRQPVFVREPFDAIARRGQDEIVKGLIPAHGLGFLAGPSQSLKTFLALDWSLRITRAEPILGHKTRACGVVYVAAEAPNGVRKRIEAWRTVNPKVVALPFELIPQAPDLRDPKQVEDLAAELRIAAAEMEANGHRLGLIVVDTLAASMPGADENGAVDMSTVLSNVADLSAAAGAFVLIVSHTGKDEGRGLRGWSGQFAGADCVVMLTREEGEPTRYGRVAKLKDGEDGERFAISLEKVSLGFDQDGDEVTSGVIKYEDVADAPPKRRKSRPLNPGETVVLTAVKHVTDHGETTSVPATVPGAKAWQKAVTRAAVKARAMTAGFASEDVKPETVRQQFHRSIQGLIAAGKIRVEGELVWLLGGVTT